jgi:hypothetical protein
MTSGTPEPSPQDVMREQKLQRNLKIVVVGLGVIILLGLGAVIVRVIGLAGGKAGSESGQIAKTLVALPSDGSIAMELPKGARIISVSLSGNRLAVHHDGPSGAGISILDLETGRRIADIKAVEAMPRN